MYQYILAARESAVAFHLHAVGQSGPVILLENIAGLVGVVMVLGGLGVGVGTESNAGCFVVLAGIALIVLSLGFSSGWSLHYLLG